MEAVLKSTAEAMPKPSTQFEMIAARAAGERVAREKKSHGRLRPVLIALAAVMLLAGCATAYGAYKISRGTWNLYISHNLVDAKQEMNRYGIALPEEFDGCGFREMSVGSSVPHGVSYMEAIFSGYRSVHVTYGADDLSYSIAVGDTKDEYWMTYFDYESEDLWRGEGDYLAVEYAGCTIHTGYYLYNGTQYKKATWVDPERKICVSVQGYEGNDPLPLAKLLIDNMK